VGVYGGIEVWGVVLWGCAYKIWFVAWVDKVYRLGVWILNVSRERVGTKLEVEQEKEVGKISLGFWILSKNQPLF